MEGSSVERLKKLTAEHKEQILKEIDSYYKPGGHRTIIKDINSHCHVLQPNPEEYPHLDPRGFYLPPL